MLTRFKIRKAQEKNITTSGSSFFPVGLTSAEEGCVTTPEMTSTAGPETARDTCIADALVTCVFGVTNEFHG